VYTGQTGRTIENRIKEHQRNTRLLQTEKSALVEQPTTGSQNLVSEYKNSIKDIGIYGASHYGGYPGGNSS
jgi:hypothetical protein